MGNGYMNRWQQFFDTMASPMGGFDPYAPGDTPTFTGQPIYSQPDSAGAMPTGETEIYDRILGMLGGQFDQMVRQQNNSPWVAFPNSGFFARHPKVTSFLDNALITSALIGDPQPTVGGNIAAVARGVLGAPDFKRKTLLERQMSPLQVAGQIADIAKARRDAAAFETDRAYKQALTKESAARTEQTKQDDYLTTPRVSDQGVLHVYNKTKKQWESMEETGGVRQTFANERRRQARDVSGFKTVEERFVSGQMLQEINDARSAAGRPPLTQEQLGSQLGNFYGARSFVTSAGGAGGRIARGDIPQDLQMELDDIDRVHDDEMKRLEEDFDYSMGLGFSSYRDTPGFKEGAKRAEAIEASRKQAKADARARYFGQPAKKAPTASTPAPSTTSPLPKAAAPKRPTTAEEFVNKHLK